MDENSKGRGYLTGILVMLGILLIGYVLNPIVGVLGIVRLIWPQNLYFIALLMTTGVAIGLLSESAGKKATNSSFMMPSFLALGICAFLVFVWPNGVENVIINKVLTTPALILSVFVYLNGGIYVAVKMRNFRKSWAKVLLLFTFLAFTYSTVVSQHDYYHLSMRIGEERALFEAEAEDGKFYRLPFAVKLLPGDENSKECLVRFFSTVQDFSDVSLNGENNYRLKGWDVRLKNVSDVTVDSSKLVDLQLIFDRWIELKFISLGLLIISLIIRLKY